jgi:hypothetical protein
MKAGIFMLGLLLMFVLLFAHWLREPHRLGAHWYAMDRGLKQVDLDGEPVSR